MVGRRAAIACSRRDRTHPARCERLRRGQGHGADDPALTQALRALPRVGRGEVESSLRCTEAFDDGTRETLFPSEAGSLRALGRTRESTPDELRRAPTRPEIAATALGWGRTAFVAVLPCAVFTLLAWRGGRLDAVPAHTVDDIVPDSGTLGGALLLALARSA